MTTSVIELDQISTSLLRILPRFAPAQRRLSVALYRLLAEGSPVPLARLAATLGIAEREAQEILTSDLLRSFVYRDDVGRVIGFGGLAIVPMHHRFEVDGRTLYTWCAWDSLFIPEMLGRPARVESPCPETQETIRMTIAPQGLGEVSHPEPVVSFLVPDAFGADAQKTMASFCHYVFFLASPAAGAAWTARHPGTFLLSLDQAFELGRRKNAVQFGNAS